MVTIRDVAEYCGVSASTVSHVLNKTRHVDSETAARIREAVNVLGYRPLRVHHQHPGGKLAVGLFAVAEPLWEEDVMQPMYRMMEKEDIRLITVTVNRNTSWEDLRILVKYYRLDRCVVHGSVALKGKPMPVGVPLALLDDPSYPDGPPLWSVSRDWEKGLRKGLDHLLKRGHQKIVLVIGEQNNPSQQNLVRTFHHVLNEYGTDHSGVVIYLNDWPDLRLPQSHTALIAVGPGTTRAVVSRLKQIGQTVPHDWSLVSVGETEAFYCCFPEMTRAFFPWDGAVSSLLAWILVPETPPESEKIEPRFFPGETTLAIARGPSGHRASPPEALELSSRELALVQRQDFGVCVAAHDGRTLFSKLLIQGITETLSSLGMKLLALGDAEGSQELHGMQLYDFSLMMPHAIISFSNNHDPQYPRLRAIADSSAELILGVDLPRELSGVPYGICVATNEAEKGRMAAKHLALRMLDDGRRNIGFFCSGGKNFGANQCDEAAVRTIDEEFPEINILFRGRLTSWDNLPYVLERYLDEYPNLEGIYIYNADAALLLQDILRGRKQDVLLITTQINYEIARRCRKDRSIAGIASSRPHEMGRCLALAAAGKLLGLDRPPYVAMDPVLITGDNIEKSWISTAKSKPPDERRENNRKQSPGLRRPNKNS